MKPIFVPLLHNGNGSVMANFMMCHGEAFAGRTIDMRAIGDSHAGRGMNRTACDFLESDCDTWLNIDADILFTSKDVARILGPNIPLLYGLYPKRQEDTPPCLGTFAQGPIERPDGLVEVRRCGRGFMRVDRSVLEAMKEENGGHARKFFNHGRPEWEFFESGVVTGEMSALEDGAAEWISEDWYFCERARQIGVPTLVDPSISLGHEGNKVFRFSTDQVTRIDSNILSWKEIHGWFDYEDLYREIVAFIPDGGAFVEVGSWLGRSICAFDQFAKQAGKSIAMSCVDTFQGESGNEVHGKILATHHGSVENAFRANLKALGVDPKIIVGDSAASAALFQDGQLHAVFIDADHSEKAVRADITAWLPKVKSGGMLCGHDFDESGVSAAVRGTFPPEAIRTVGRCWVYRKP